MDQNELVKLLDLNYIDKLAQSIDNPTTLELSQNAYDLFCQIFYPTHLVKERLDQDDKAVPFKPDLQAVQTNNGRLDVEIVDGDDIVRVK